MCGAFGVPGHVTDICFPEIIRIIKPGKRTLFQNQPPIMKDGAILKRRTIFEGRLRDAKVKAQVFAKPRLKTQHAKQKTDGHSF